MSLVDDPKTAVVHDRGCQQVARGPVVSQNGTLRHRSRVLTPEADFAIHTVHHHHDPDPAPGSAPLAGIRSPDLVAEVAFRGSLP